MKIKRDGAKKIGATGWNFVIGWILWCGLGQKFARWSQNFATGYIFCGEIFCGGMNVEIELEYAINLDRDERSNSGLPKRDASIKEIRR